MKPHESQSVPAVCGLDYIRGPGGVVLRTEKGWKRWAAKEARRRSKADGFTWHASVAWIDHRDCFRISFGGQSEQVV